MAALFFAGWNVGSVRRYFFFFSFFCLHFWEELADSVWPL